MKNIKFMNFNTCKFVSLLLALTFILTNANFIDISYASDGDVIYRYIPSDESTHPKLHFVDGNILNRDDSLAVASDAKTAVNGNPYRHVPDTPTFKATSDGFVYSSNGTFPTVKNSSDKPMQGKQLYIFGGDDNHEGVYSSSQVRTFKTKLKVTSAPAEISLYMLRGPQNYNTDFIEANINLLANPITATYNNYKNNAEGASGGTGGWVKIVGTPSMPLGEWVELAVVYEITTWDCLSSLYINGILAAKVYDSWGRFNSMNYNGVVPAFVINPNWSSGSNFIASTIEMKDISITEGRSVGRTLDFSLPSEFTLPAQGEVFTIPLNGVVKTDGVIDTGISVGYEVLSDAQGVVLDTQNKVLKIGYEAKDIGSVTVKCSMPYPYTEILQTITFCEPDIYILFKDNSLEFTGSPNSIVNLAIYKPKDTTNVMTSLKEHFSKFDGSGDDKCITTSFYLDADGKYTYDVSSLSAGAYKAFAYADDINKEGSCAFKLHLDHALTNSPDENIAHEDFPALLASQANIDLEVASDLSIRQMALTDKASFYKLLNGSFSEFKPAVLISEMNASSSCEVSKISSVVAAMSDNAYAIDLEVLLARNLNYSDVISKSLEVYSDGGVYGTAKYIEILREKSILEGIAEATHDLDASIFLDKANITKYNNANSSQKEYISKAVGGTLYGSLALLEQAINDLSLPTGITPSSPSPSRPAVSGNGNVGGGNVISGGSVSANPPSTVPPVDKTLFSDVARSHWGYEAINYLAQRNIINGYGDKFSPEGLITRAEFIKILVCTFKPEKTGECGFTDVDKNSWYYEYVAKAYVCGLVNGADGKFNPDSNITRQDMAVMVHRFMKYSSLKLSDSSHNFNDHESISDYAKSAIEVLAGNGVINGTGDNNFNPLGTATRAEASQLIFNILSGGYMQ